MKEFCLAALRIGKKCSPNIKKILSDELYFFCDRCIPEDNGVILNPNYSITNNIYGYGINLHAIVGMNGSGKSSLLEIVYRIINNFACKYKLWNEKVGLYFVDNLFASLYFVIDGKLYEIKCEKRDVILLKEKEEIAPEKLIKEDNEIIDMFYSIITNYSMQSLVISDFKDEITIDIMKKGWQRGKPWLQKIFYKNDGYLTPLVLNPFRDASGVIDVMREEHLADQRLSLLFLYYHDKMLIENYRLKTIRYKFNKEHIEQKISKWLSWNYDEIIAKTSRKQKDPFFKELYKAYGIDNISQGSFFETYSNSYACFILKKKGVKTFKDKSKYFVYACVYLVCKILNIAETYPSYSNFSKIGGAENFGKNIEDEKLVESLIKKIDEDKSHITAKVKRVERFLKTYKRKNIKEYEPFSIEQYLSDNQLEKMSFQELNESLPPSFFVPEIILYHSNDTKREEFSLQKMSSGERQFLYTISTFIYHLNNLSSIQDCNRIKYKNVNLILDEVEICFHPEYQRQFIYKFISLLKSLKLNEHFCFNILFATHSPFILSDIPQNNILYLEKGVSVGNKIKVNPFAANVNDVLAQSFFMNEGFVGKFAQQIVNSLALYLKGKKSNGLIEWDEEKAEYFIKNTIGEPVVKKCLDALMKDFKLNEDFK